jgi:fructose-bisphosphate aldolase class I
MFDSNREHRGRWHFRLPAPIQQPALERWGGKDTNVPPAQQALYHRASCNRAARRGEYSNAMEKK